MIFHQVLIRFSIILTITFLIGQALLDINGAAHLQLGQRLVPRRVDHHLMIVARRQLTLLLNIDGVEQYPISFYPGLALYLGGRGRFFEGAGFVDVRADGAAFVRLDGAHRVADARFVAAQVFDCFVVAGDGEALFLVDKLYGLNEVEVLVAAGNSGVRCVLLLYHHRFVLLLVGHSTF